MKIKNFFKKYKWWIITGILLLIIPIIVLVIMHKLDYINNSDNAEIIGGCLGYYGTVILGIILFKEPVSAVRLLCIAFIITGITGLKLISN